MNIQFSSLNHNQGFLFTTLIIRLKISVYYINSEFFWLENLSLFLLYWLYIQVLHILVPWDQILGPRKKKIKTPELDESLEDGAKELNILLKVFIWIEY